MVYFLSSWYPGTKGAIGKGRQAWVNKIKTSISIVSKSDTEKEGFSRCGNSGDLATYG